MLLNIMFYGFGKVTGQVSHYNHTHSALCVWPLSHIMYDMQSTYFQWCQPQNVTHSTRR